MKLPCGTRLDHVTAQSSHDHARHPRHASRHNHHHNPKLGSAVYFTAQNDVLELKSGATMDRLPTDAFTVEAWIKPEGGQYDPAVIVGKKPIIDHNSHCCCDSYYLIPT